MESLKMESLEMKFHSTRILHSIPSYSKSSLPIDPLIVVCFLSALGGAESKRRKLPRESRNYPDL